MHFSAILIGILLLQIVESHSHRFSAQHPVKSKFVGSCPRLETPASGYVFISGVYNGAVAKYTCQYGYKAVPSSIRYCLYGSWTGVPPKCSESFTSYNALYCTGMICSLK